MTFSRISSPSSCKSCCGHLFLLLDATTGYLCLLVAVLVVAVGVVLAGAAGGLVVVVIVRIMMIQIQQE
jgi:hypothetical protein